MEVRGPGKTTFIQIAYRSPAAGSADFFAFTVLDSLLTGPTSLNMFGGGGTSNKTSRLYRALVEKELAIGVGGGTQATIDPFLYEITITVRTGQSVDAILKTVDAEIGQLQAVGQAGRDCDQKIGCEIESGRQHESVFQMRTVKSEQFAHQYADAYHDDGRRNAAQQRMPQIRPGQQRDNAGQADQAGLRYEIG